MQGSLKGIAFLFGTWALLAAGTEAKRPNVIVIMTDDTGNNIGYQGNPHVKTPHIDKMASEGVSLSNFHQMPMCTTSRAGLMSGQYAEHTGAWRTSLGRTMMRGDVYTVAEVFRDHGYATGHYGKWPAAYRGNHRHPLGGR
ncbi:Arylsulfatase [Pontiella desulfatans]|uniref:Arylsulfatase n=1 Tax=Pontiella desulfatans TaxID=2750659 RepID=A0A6C2UA69_PONDE|nr:sulfatase-like hydrolase/transferase [Pontiella desulfatans]VGO16276.1 Arylsulfatase [Pontiella desulfatans]